MSERLLVSTIHDGISYRAVFRRGGLVTLLGKAGLTEEAFGTSWITFKPDEAVVPGTLSFDEARRLMAKLADEAHGVELSVADRSQEKPYWW